MAVVIRATERPTTADATMLVIAMALLIEDQRPPIAT